MEETTLMLFPQLQIRNPRRKRMSFGRNAEGNIKLLSKMKKKKIV